MGNESTLGALLQACGLADTARSEALDIAAEILECITDAFVFLGADWRYRYVNAHAGVLFGREPSGLLGKHIWSEFPEGVGQPFHLAYERAAKEQVFVQLEAYYPPWGRWYENRIYPSKSGLAIFFQDVTERRRQQEERATFARLVENATDFIGLAAIDGGIRYVNEAGLRLVGLDSLEQALTRRVGDLLAPESLTRSLEEELPSVLASGHWEGDCQMVHVKTGQRIDVLVASFLIRDPLTRAPLYLATVRHDVTARRALEGQLRQAQKMEAIGRLAAGVAHDFNNLLTVLSGMTSLVKRDAALGEPSRGHLGEIDTTLERAAALSRRLLSLGRTRPSEPRVVDVNEAVREAHSLHARLLPAEIELRVELAPGVLPVRIGLDQLEQVLLNLILNARDAMPDGGTLTVATSDGGDRVELSVVDTGVGMSHEVQARVAEPFFTTKEEGRGTGLGLSTVQGIVEQSGGRFTIASAPGRGSTFTVSFPKSAEQPGPRAAGGPPRPRPQARGTLLLVEADGVLRATLRQVLEAEGYRVLDTSGADNALRLARAHGSLVDLLLTDVRLPVVGGAVLAARLRERFPALRVLFLSGFDEPASSLPRGDAFLRKPFTADALAERVRELLEG